jgi:hypothetical protein
LGTKQYEPLIENVQRKKYQQAHTNQKGRVFQNRFPLRDQQVVDMMDGKQAKDKGISEPVYLGRA